MKMRKYKIYELEIKKTSEEVNDNGKQNITDEKCRIC